MASSRPRGGSFSRNISSAATAQISGVKLGPNGTSFVSSGIPDLDQILGGGFTLGSLVMVMEDPEAPHHMLLLRNFMSQGLIHKQPLLYASPERDPRGFLGTLPSPMASKEEKSHEWPSEQDANLRIAWQYKKYLGEKNSEFQRGGKAEYCNDFDLRKPLERHFYSGQQVDCISLRDSPNLAPLLECCSTFSAQISKYWHPFSYIQL